jgi:hypothetical protein
MAAPFPSTALQDPQLLLVRGLLHVSDGDAAPCSRALHLGDIHTQLLGLLLGCLRGVRLLAATLLASSGLLGHLPCSLLSLLGCLTCGVLSLLRGSSGCLLGLARHLSGLIGDLSSGVLDLARHLPDLIRDSAQRTSAALLAACEPAHGLLGLARHLPGLIGDLTCGVLDLLGCPSGCLLGLARHLSGLIGRLPNRLLGLARCLSSGILSLLGRSLQVLLYLLLGLLGGLIHLVFDAHVLGRLINRALEFDVGVDHLLDLGLRVALGERLRKLLQLGAVVLDLALEAAYRLPVEVLGVLRGLLLHLLLKVWCLVSHFISFFLVDSRFR